MSRYTPPFTIGIEEEYHLVDLETREIANDPPDALFTDCTKRLGENVTHEFKASQIEIGTRVCDSPAEARAELVNLRAGVAEISAQYGLAPIAAATHPISRWQDSRHTDATRYIEIARDLGTVAERLLISGMHIHVGLGDDDELRMDMLNQVAYFLPHLLALSTSSPFWQGKDTGLASYRLAIFTELPRTGLPEYFETFVDYQRHVNTLVQAGVLQDATKIWWDLRPSARFPTIEMRICDVCTHVDDAAAIAALFMCIMRMLYRLKGSNQRWRQYNRMLVAENRWRAQRYGIDEPLIDFGRGELVDIAELVEELLVLTQEDAAEAGCENELNHIRTILERGTSAHRQRKAYELAISSGASHEDALKAVVDMLVETTRES